jgi:hypothetical protein
VAVVEDAIAFLIHHLPLRSPTPDPVPNDAVRDNAVPNTSVVPDITTT